MNRILSDFLWRWGWVYLLSLTVGMLTLWYTGDFSQFCFQIPILCFVTGPLLLHGDLSRGAGRALLSLPRARRTVANTYWIIMVGIPTLISLIIVAWSARLISSVPGDRTIMILPVWLALGGCSLMHLGIGQSGIPWGPPTGVLRSWYSSLFGVFMAGWIVGLTMFPDVTYWNQLQWLHWIMLGLGTLAALASWPASKRLVISGAVRRAPQKNLGRKETGPAPPPRGLGGWAYLWWRQLALVLLVSLMVLGLECLLVFFLHGFSYDKVRGNLSQPNHRALVLTWGFVVGAVYNVRWAHSLRALRTLPASSWRITLMLLTMATVPGTVFFLFLAGGLALITDPIAPAQLLYAGLLLASYCSLIVPLDLLLSPARQSASLGLVGPFVLLALDAYPLEYAPTGLGHLILAWTLCVGVILVSAVYLNHLVGHRSACYRTNVTSDAVEL